MRKQSTAGAGIVCFPQMEAYNVAKSVVITLSETLYSELAPYGLGVTVVCLSFTRTNIFKPAYCTEEELRELVEMSAAKAGTPPEYNAEQMLRAVEKDRLFVKPRFPLAIYPPFRRFAPSSYFKTLALLTRKWWFWAMSKMMARLGVLR